MTLALDGDLWWGVGNPDDVRAGDTIVSVIGNRYTAAPIRGVIVVDDTELDDDLVRDMTEVLTSFCARLYGASRRKKQGGDDVEGGT